MAPLIPGVSGWERAGKGNTHGKFFEWPSLEKLLPSCSGLPKVVVHILISALVVNMSGNSTEAFLVNAIPAARVRLITLNRGGELNSSSGWRHL